MAKTALDMAFANATGANVTRMSMAAFSRVNFVRCFLTKFILVNYSVRISISIIWKVLESLTLFKLRVWNVKSLKAIANMTSTMTLDFWSSTRQSSKMVLEFARRKIQMAVHFALLFRNLSLL